MHLFKGTISVVLTVAYFACILVSGSILDLSKVHHELKGLSEPLRFQQRVSSCLGDVSDTSSSNCEVVTYLSDFMQLKAKVLNPLPEGAKIPKPDDVIEETGSYAKAFQDHIVNRKPFVQAMSPGYNNISMLMCWKDSQSFHEKVNTLTNDVALADCQKQQYDTILDRVTIPKVVAGSYIHKMDSKHVSGSNDLIDYRKQWPSLFAFDKSKALALHQCPLNMHMVVWGAQTQVTARLFLKGSGKLSVKMGENPAIYPHYPEYASLPEDEKTWPKYSSVVINKDQFLFVPNNYVAQFDIGDSAPTIDEEDKTLIRFCLADASNYKEFLTSLES